MTRRVQPRSPQLDVLSPGTHAASRGAIRPWPGPLADAQDRKVTHPPRDLTPLPDLLHGAALAGPVRTRRPVYLDLLPPCNAGCPAGENIQAWLGFTQAGQHEQAWRQLVADNPLPASTAGSATTRAKASATAPIWTAPCPSTRSSG